MILPCVLRRGPMLLTTDATKLLLPRIEALRSYGATEAVISTLFRAHPWVIAHSRFDRQDQSHGRQAVHGFIRPRILGALHFDPVHVGQQSCQLQAPRVVGGAIPQRLRQASVLHVGVQRQGQQSLGISSSLYLWNESCDGIIFKVIYQIAHKDLTSFKGQAEKDKAPWEGVRARDLLPFLFSPTAISRRWRPSADPAVSFSASVRWLPTVAMEIERMRQLMLLWLRRLSTRVALVGGNHTAARFCSR
ncbi:hypothetical protein Cni_G04934 [Canna indica]|uniref:Uncharacterized protein n=1 Tax=Canna indica TaxID=4628 RepID=A0AAQ3JWB1_9LILI|nr:hypothetical protein Cni_G04934 [Canna indica]